MPLFPIIETWMAQVSAVMLVGAFLQYVSKRDDVGRQYLKFALSGITVALLIAAVTSGPAAGTHIEGFRPPRGPMVPMILIGAGMLAMVWGFALSMKLTKGTQRTAMLIGIGVFACREVLKISNPFGGAAVAGHPDLTMVTVATQSGAMCFGYIYMREYADEVRADFEALEERVQERTAELNEANQRLLVQSTVDSLTGLHNRRYFEEELVKEWVRSLRQSSSVAIAIVDVDDFKAVNDSHGHQTGDYCLVEVAKVLRTAATRASDVVARYGGDEFVLLLPGTDAAGAEDILESVRGRIQALIRTDGLTARVTVSVGIAACTPSAAGSAQELIRRADGELYEPKKAGRDRISARLDEAYAT